MSQTFITNDEMVKVAKETKGQRKMSDEKEMIPKDENQKAN